VRLARRGGKRERRFAGPAGYDKTGMKKDELATRLARKAKVSKATAADRLDEVIHDILASLKRGQTATLPGLGKFVPGKRTGFEFEPPKNAQPGKRKPA
jgi:nucleoid DNA-binding protein